MRKESRPVELHLALRRVVLLGTPLTLAILEFFHPLVSRDLAGTLFPVAGWWVTLHVVQLVLFAFMGAALWLLTDGLHGIATTVSRLGAAVFVVFYGAGDTLMGIATGILARGAGDLPTEVREGRPSALAAGNLHTPLRCHRIRLLSKAPAPLPTPSPSDELCYGQACPLLLFPRSR